jgi:TonB family protein
MYFNFDDSRPDTPRLPQPITRREVVLLTINLHAMLAIVILLGPRLPWVRAAIERQQQEQQERARAELERQRERERARFVFVQPRLDTPAPKPPPIADLSDRDRRARTVERSPKPSNPLPFAKGNSPEFIETPPPAAATRKPAPAETPPQNGDGESKPSLTLPEAPNALERPPDSTRQAEPRGPAVGVIADAIRNVRKYTQQENFGNLRGGQDPNMGESIQFDSKGVEFGPWLARFVAQVRSNWLIPQAAMSMRGHVVITFFVHKDGRITDVTVAQPSAVNAFTLAARNAILTSNPTVPLPPEYPDEKAFFTVTFYYNEQPPGR